MGKFYEIIDSKNKISDEIVRKCSYAYNENRKFFGKNCKFFKILIANTEREFRKLSGKFYSPWAKGVSVKGKFIVIRCPELFHKTYLKFGGTFKFEALLAHEINHIFANHLNLYEGPYWFTEGIAMYVAGQIPGKVYKNDVEITKEKAKSMMFYRLIMRKLCMDMYVFHYLGVDYLIKKFGREKLLELIRLQFKDMKKKEYEGLFKKVYGVSYNKFIKDFVDQV